MADTIKTVILAGGIGSRLAEETDVRPKPMVAIGGRPILWHILKTYGHYGLTDFTICLGYKGYVIKEYFANYVLHNTNVTLDLAENRVEFHDKAAEPWRVTLIDTGDDTMTGGRLRRVADHLGEHDCFCMTYGDGLADVDISALLDFHRGHGRLATMTVVQPPGRFGATLLDGDRVTEFVEKPRGDGGAINGGFFVLSKKILDYIDGDASIWEQEPLQQLPGELTLAGQLLEDYGMRDCQIVDIGCGGKTNSTAAQFGYGRSEFGGDLGNIGLNDWFANFYVDKAKE